MPKEINWQDLKDHKGKPVIMEYKGHLEETVVEYFENNVLGIIGAQGTIIYITPNPEWKDKPEIKIYSNGK